MSIHIIEKSLKEITPVEEYNGIYYKREDLLNPFGDNVNGSKIRQAYELFKNYGDMLKDEYD